MPKMKIFTLLAALSMLSFTTAQNIYIVDQQSKTALPYTHFIVYHNNQIIEGQYAQKDGAVRWNAMVDFDSVVVSNVGFQKVVFTKKPISDTIVLKNLMTMLPEIPLSENTNLEPGKAGKRKPKTSYFILNKPGTFQYITLIHNPFGVSKKIKSFAFFHRKSATKGQPEVRIIVFANDSGSPGKQIDLEKTIYLADYKQRKIQIDLQHYNLTLPAEGVFIGIEFLGCNETIGKKEKSKMSTCSMAFKFQSRYDDPEIKFYCRDPNHNINRYWVDVNDILQSQKMSAPNFSIEIGD
jgi:hypothetical protein